MSSVKKLFKKPRVKDPQQETEAPAHGGNGPLLWYPEAIKCKTHTINGTYNNYYPKGAVIHFTAGHDKTEQNALDTMEYGRKQGYAYMLIGPTGKVYQAHALDKHGSHAGKSYWPGLGSNVSKDLVGIEIANAGEVDSNNESWFGVKQNSEDIRQVSRDYGCPPGRYKKYTIQQEAALFKLLLWMKENNPDIFDFDYVLGHHEVAGERGIGYFRKSDPGGALSMTMDEFRKELHTLWKEKNSSKTLMT
jgi:N-acetyl-anhydromuramyl-L-alanine amidase AmpD